MSSDINKSIFKAYDVRGRYPEEISEAAASQIAEALAGQFKKGLPADRQGKLVLGRDVRLSSSSIYEAMREVFQERGFEIEEVGVCTTPMFYFLCNELKAVGGVMVTASHAPKDFNGLKVVGGNGEVISGAEILKWIPLETAPALARPGGALGRAVSNGMDYLKPYVDFLKSKIKLAEPVSVVFDCSNGTTGMVVKELRVESLKLKVINENPDGNFPAHGPNPLAEGALRELQSEVLKSKAELGVIFDADGDRAFFVDDLGREVPADAVLFLLADNFPGPAVANVLAGYLAKELFGRSSKELIESRVGHYFMKKIMKERSADFGGEFSGHYFFPLGESYFDSGILAAVYMVNEASKMKADGRKLSDWIDGLPAFYRSGELNFEVKDKEAAMAAVEKKYSALAERVSKLDGLKMEFADWWCVLRPSNTENFLRLVMEAKSEEVLKAKLAEIKSLI